MGNTHGHNPHGHHPHGHTPYGHDHVPHSHTALNHTVHNHTNYSPPACGTNWGSYVLANSGAADCSSCGEAITSYNDCATAAAWGAAALGIGGLGDAETWDGPPGCHIQDGDNFQFNTNMDGGSADGHTPVCLASHARLLVKSAPPSPPPG